MIKKLGFAGALMVLALSLSGQDSITFTGKIVNSSNDPFPGVTVNYEGSIGNPAITDSTGLFELMIPAPDIWLLTMIH